ncbi:serine hydrolase [Nonomuraea sp. CA-218870]|uniref:serine hydrolase n=1 Tax=Nonomuraea sp. CA-218870 TaxID=3239998 RepID=UPI003D89DC20
MLDRMALLDQIRALNLRLGGAAMEDEGALPVAIRPTDVEILRDDLAGLLYQATRREVEYVFDDSVAAGAGRRRRRPVLPGPTSGEGARPHDGGPPPPRTAQELRSRLRRGAAVTWPGCPLTGPSARGTHERRIGRNRRTIHDDKDKITTISRNSLSEQGLRRLREVLTRHVVSGRIPGLVALVSHGEETHVEAIGTMRHDGGAPMRRDTIFRMASTSKPVLIAAAMALLMGL